MHLLHSGRGLFDAFPVSVLSLQTVAAVGALAGRELEPLRFRPNIVIDAPGGEFPEEALIGRELRIGGARLRLDVRDSALHGHQLRPAHGGARSGRAARRRSPPGDVRGRLRLVRRAGRSARG